MSPRLAGGLSGNALLSIAVTGFGLLFVVRPANLALKWLLPVYLLILLALLSASLNGDVVGGINVAVKYAYMIVILIATFQALRRDPEGRRSEEHTSELQSLMRISYAVFCLKKKKQLNNPNTTIPPRTHNT